MEDRHETSTSENPKAGELKDWVTPELIVEDVKSVTRGGGTYPIVAVEDVVASYYTSF